MIIDGWNEEPVNKIILYPGSRAWLHRYGLENHMYGEKRFDGTIPGFSYSYTVNIPVPVVIKKESDIEPEEYSGGLIIPFEEEQVYGPGE